MKVEFPGPDRQQCEQALQYWTELLHGYGSEEWGPAIVQRFDEELPVSFRELQQMIAYSAREWTAKKYCSGNGK